MCTLTVVPLPGGRRRIAFNRDESRVRPAGLPPVHRRFGARDALSPIDPQSGGTWLAVNDAGLVLAVLNGNPVRRQEASQESRNPVGRNPGIQESRKPEDSQETAAETEHAPGQGAAGGVSTGFLSPGFLDSSLRSRGTIIPGLLEYATPAAALAALEQTIRYRDFAPFRLVLVGDGVAADVRWDGVTPMVMNRLIGGTPLLFTSSGLGDHLVEGVRRELFDGLFSSPPEEWETVQDVFHRHRWPGREHLSVNMDRATARTVSHSVIDLVGDRATFTYHPDAPDRPAERTVLHLPFSQASVT